MAIHTQYGNPCEVIARHQDYATSGWVDVRVTPDGGRTSYQRSAHISELRADGGAVEIDKAARSAPIRREDRGQLIVDIFPD